MVKQEPLACDITPSKLIAGDALRTLYLALARYGCAMKAGKTRLNAAYLPPNAAMPRPPMIMFFGHDRYEAYRRSTPNYRQMPYQLVPDVVADHWREDAAETAALYLHDGVEIVCLLDTRQHTIRVYASEKPPLHLRGAAVLNLETVLPGFQITLPQLFTAD